MKIVLLFVFFINSFVSFSQIDKIKGRWILDYVTYENGESLELDHPLYSIFNSLDLSDDLVVINNSSKLKAKYTDFRITAKNIIYNYSFDNKYLVIKEFKVDKKYYFLRVADFRVKYPEVNQAKVDYNGRKVVKYNELLDIHSLAQANIELFHEFVQLIKSYNQHSRSNKIFKANFVLTADNKIEDVTIVNSVSEKFDKEFIAVSPQLAMLYKNNSGVDVLMEYNDYLGRYFPKSSEDEIVYFENLSIADYYYKNKQYALAHQIYSLLYNNKHIVQLGNQYRITHLYKNLIICYLSTDHLLEACLMLNDVKETDYFKVKNYLLKYCP